MCLLGALAAPAIATAAPVPAPPVQAGTPLSDTDACPYRSSPAGDRPDSPAPLPVPEPVVGGGLLAGCGFVLPPGAQAPPEGIDSSGWLVADLTAGTVLAAKDPHGRYRPASTIKVLLAQVVLRDLPLDAVVVGTEEDDRVIGSTASVTPGVQYTVRQLLEGLLLVSGNDAANALARALGGVDVAVGKMNELAWSLGALDTRAATPSGLEGPGMSTSAYDMALILRNAQLDPRFLEIAQTRTAAFPGPNGQTSQLTNQNRLLTDVEGAVAGKTGFTNAARQTFVGAVDRNGRRYLVVQLYGSSSSGSYWQQFNRLLDYGIAMGSGSVGLLVNPTPPAPPGPVVAAPPPAGYPTTTGDSGLAYGDDTGPNVGGSGQLPVTSSAAEVIPVAAPPTEPGFDTRTRMIISVSGFVVIAVLVTAAFRTRRSR